MWTDRRERIESVARRAASDATGLPQRCYILGCGRQTMRAAGKGLAAFYCRQHIEHRARHGSLWHSTYKAADLKPYRDAAAQWIKAHRETPLVSSTLDRLTSLLAFAGPAETAMRLRGLKPAKRADIALARLREAGVEPARILEIHLAVAALMEEDPASHRSREFRLVQTAKAIHRMASGSHRRWDIPKPNGGAVPFELHAYPRSRGRVLRHLGETVERYCEAVASDHLATILALKVVRHGRHPALEAANA